MHTHTYTHTRTHAHTHIHTHTHTHTHTYTHTYTYTCTHTHTQHTHTHTHTTHTHTHTHTHTTYTHTYTHTHMYTHTHTTYTHTHTHTHTGQVLARRGENAGGVRPLPGGVGLQREERWRLRHQEIQALTSGHGMLLAMMTERSRSCGSHGDHLQLASYPDTCGAVMGTLQIQRWL